MNRARSAWIAALTILVVVAPAIAGGSDARGGKYSGTVIKVDQSAGTIVVEGMGPWQIKEGVTQLERRTIGVMPSTEFVRLKRATGPAPSGWVGDFVESALPGWQVKPGDWVTVTVKTDDKRPTAVRIDVWEPSEG
ncbi:MAG TPA: hypothetical protein VIG07_17465 [Methylomirabilota bacterium]|jgi:hypothetical protein